MMITEAKSTFSFLFNTVVQYISDTVGLLIFSCSPDYFKECIAATFI